MGMNDDRFEGAAPAPEGHGSDAAAPRGARPGSRGKITTRPSRESILQSYASQDEMRARNARMYSQAQAQSYAASAAQRDADRLARQEALAAQQREQEALRAAREAQQARQPQPPAGGAGARRTRVVPPLSSQESFDRTRSSQASYERARASRDALSEARRGRALNREVIDGRGSIDSRTFNESHQISGYSRDDRDRHDPTLDTVNSRTNWHSRAGQGFEAVPDPASRNLPLRPREVRGNGVGFSGGVMSGRADYTAPRGGSGVPLFLKIAIPVIVVLLVVIIVLLFR